jgi:replicative DNA helicase
VAAVIEKASATAALAEATIAAAAILVPSFWEATLRLPEPDDFDDPDLAQLWTAILEARQRGPVSKTAVRRELRDLGWNEASPFKALEKAFATPVTLPEGIAAVDLILARRLQRQAMSVCRETLKELETAVDIEDVVRRHEIRIVDVASRADGASAWKRGDQVVEEHVERLETGIETFDRVNGGLPQSALTIVAGRPGMGKSAFIGQVLRNVSKRGYGAGCFSLEMDTNSYLNRLAAAEAYDSRLREPGEKPGSSNPYYSHYERRQLHGELLERFEAAKARIKKLPIYWDDVGGRTLPQIRMGGRRVRTEMGRDAVDLRLLVIDHIGHIEGDGRERNRHLELGGFSKGLMQLGKELRIPVVALAQLNRDVEKRPDKRPMIQDLRESGRLEEDAHDILLLYRQAYYDDQARERGEEVDEIEAEANRHILEINTVKSRGGMLKRVKVFCEAGANAILDSYQASAHLQRPIQKDLYG